MGESTDGKDGAWPGAIAAITLFVEDLAEAKRFYGEVFGLPVVYEDENSTVFRFGETLIIPASQLAAYETRAEATSSDGLPPPETFVLIPPGNRAFYCFAVIGLVRNAKVGLPPGFDLCAGALGKVLLQTRGLGQDELVPLTLGKVTSLSFAVPIYRGGYVPTTSAARLSAFVGWSA